MAKAKKTKNSPKNLKALAVKVADLFAAESDGDPEKLAALIRERIGVTQAVFDRWQSGDAVPVDGKVELLEGLLSANEGKDAAAPIKPRKAMTKKETQQVESVKALHDLTRHPEFTRFVASLNRKDLALQRELRGDLSAKATARTRGMLDAFDWIRESVLAPAVGIAKGDKEAPLFATKLMVKVDSEKLLVTVGAR